MWFNLFVVIVRYFPVSCYKLSLSLFLFSSYLFICLASSYYIYLYFSLGFFLSFQFIPRQLITLILLNCFHFSSDCFSCYLYCHLSLSRYLTSHLYNSSCGTLPQCRIYQFILIKIKFTYLFVSQSCLHSPSTNPQNLNKYSQLIAHFKPKYKQNRAVFSV